MQQESLGFITATEDEESTSFLTQNTYPQAKQQLQAQEKKPSNTSKKTSFNNKQS